jgi:phospholipid transport system substrate-binding protein
MRKRFVLKLAFAAVLSCMAVSLPAAADDNGKPSADFIRSLADKAIQSLTDPTTDRAVRIERFRKMFNDNFAVRSIGKRALGRYWRQASEAEQTRYQALFEDLMVVTYVDRFANYAGEALEILKYRAEDQAIATVFTEIKRKGGAKPIRVDWTVGTNGTIYKIVDVKVEGVSMTQTLSADFASIIRQGGGIPGLLDELQKKTTQLAAQAR